jgi:DNA-binding NarL/FixJ family response regulator
LALIAAVDDLFFATRIRETARQAGVPVEVVPAAQCESLLARRNANGVASSVIVDLNSTGAVELIRNLKARTAGRPFILGFVSHVASDQISAARQAGCDQVMARSAFTQQLPELLQRLDTSS